jgi:hypothetical protein
MQQLEKQSAKNGQVVAVPTYLPVQNWILRLDYWAFEWGPGFLGLLYLNGEVETRKFPCEYTSSICRSTRFVSSFRFKLWWQVRDSLPTRLSSKPSGSLLGEGFMVPASILAILSTCTPMKALRNSLVSLVLVGIVRFN